MDDSDDTFSMRISDESIKVKKTPISGIIDDINILDYPAEIKEGAIGILKILEQDFSSRHELLSRRGSRRKQLIYYCILASYFRSEDPIDPSEIAQKFNLRSCESSRAIREYHTLEMKSLVNLELGTMDLIPRYCRRLQFTSEFVKDVENLARSILKKEPSLKDRHSPRKIAAGIISYYLESRGFSVEKDPTTGQTPLQDVFLFSEVTISQIVKIISEIDNR